MKNLISLLFILTFFLNSFVSAQFTSTTSDGRNNSKSAQAEQAEARIQQVTSDSGRYFKQGLLNLQDNRRRQSRDDFDKSIEVFLMSGIDLTSKDNAKSRDCYNQLIETVYRMEFPNDKQVPQIRALSATCGWTIENDLADKVAKLVLTAPIQQTPTKNNSLIASVVSNQSNDATTGFTEQKLELSPLDDLSKLELTTEEMIQNNSVKSNIYTPQTNSKSNNSIRIVKAVSGDTVKKVAERYGANPIDVANLNGMTSIYAALSAGREIKIPVRLPDTTLSKKSYAIVPINKDIGVKPKQFSNGKVEAVMNYFNENINDPFSMRFVRWSDIVQKSYKGKSYWSVQVKFRAKNSFGAYILTEMVFYIEKNKVVETQRIY